MLNGCVFCKETRFYYHKIKNIPTDDAVVYEDEWAFVTPDISPLVAGHCLIITKNHYNSFAGAPDQALASVNNALRFLAAKMHTAENITCFEHGAVFEGTGGASVSHAHLHVLPIKIDIASALDPLSVYTDKLVFSVERLRKNRDKQPYLWVLQNKGAYLYTVDRRLQSQFLRKLVAEQLGHAADYDWKVNHASAEAIGLYYETIRMLRG